MEKTIVIIDDEALVRESLQSALSRKKCKVLIAEDGKAGVGLLEQIQTPSLFLVDLLMPNLDGWGFLDRIREHGSKLGVQHQIFLLSGSSNAEIIAHQEQVGFIAKPFSLATIMAKINPFLDQE